MFRALAGQLQAQRGLTGQAATEAVLDLHPMQLSRYLEQVWGARSAGLLAPASLEVPAVLGAVEASAGIGPNVPPPAQRWDHLIYAYMIEQTRVYEIFRRVLRAFVIGEELGVADEASLRWLRATEALFYSDPPPFQIYALTSWIRPDIRAARRNAYYRLFGMDLNHGTDDGRPYPYDKPRSANGEFALTFEELLREVWRGIENVQNLAGANPTDEAAIEDLTLTLFDMLTSRKQNGNLAREELFYVSTMAWFHLTLSHNTPIVSTLGADASAPEERLMKIGANVGLPAHARSHSYFRIADPISAILRFVESGAFNVAPLASSALFNQPALRNAMTEIIAQWSLATGRDVKARKVAVTSAARPGRPPTGRPPTARRSPAARVGARRDGRPVGAPTTG
jgi:hypothetical protein